MTRSSQVCSKLSNSACEFFLKGQYRRCTYKMTLRRFRVTIVAGGKQEVFHILNCFRARVLVIRHANRIVSGSITFPSVACLHLPIFPHNLINNKIFGKKNLWNIKCVF
jgi:hypothetical protein